MNATYEMKLEMPSNFSIMSTEEMSYIEGGGYYLTNSDCWDLAATIGISVTGASIAIVSGAIAACGGTVAGAITTICPPAAIIAGWLALCVINSSANLADGLINALATGKGMEINARIGLIPTLTTTVR